MAAITQIEIDGFKAFPANFKLELGIGKNLLLYGENGSGKSSLYYALHVLLQSVFKDDKGAKYFKPGDVNGEEFIANNEHLINIFRFDEAKANTYTPYIRITFNDGKIWRLDNGGLSSQNGGNGSEIRMLNKDSVFINHSYISRFHAARNSEEIDLWNVFYKDILPFHLPAGTNQFLSDFYDEIVSECNSSPKPRTSRSSLKNKINDFNNYLEKLVGDINKKASSIYNDYFRHDGEPELTIKLAYYKKETPENVNKTYYQLYYGREITSILELNTPKIGIEIKESGVLIFKPQSHFNEAKLTAIALAVRFAAMTTAAITPGSFLALDDMLISLDMSNRAKVVKFLLDKSDKYKIYMFTHDRAFYNYICREINQFGKTQEWVYKTINYNVEGKEPIVIDEYSEHLSKSKHYFTIGDYETSAIYLRKQLEQCIGDLLPHELKTRADGGFVDLQTLWDKLITFYSNNRNPIDLSIQKLFNNSKLLILNVAAHYQRLSNPIYKIELEKVFELVNYIKSLDKISNKLVIEGGKQIIFEHPYVDYKCSFELDSDLEIIQNEHIVVRIPKCKNIKWAYNGVDNWDFESNMQNDNHPLLNSTPKITKFFESCCEKLPLGITHEMLIKYCKIEGLHSLLDYLGGMDLIKLSIKI